MERRRPRSLVRGIAVAAGLCLAALLAWQNGLGRLDASLYDAFSRVAPSTPGPDVVVVAIDEASLALVGRWPWGRDRQIDLIERIAAQAPAAVGLDLLLSEPSADPSVDERMAQAMRRAGNIVLPVFTARADGQVKAMLPVAPLEQAARALGHVSVEADPDGVVRSVYLREGSSARQWEHFALALLGVAGKPAPRPLPGTRSSKRPDETPAGIWWRDNWIHVNYAGPAGTYRTISAADVLLARLPDDALTGRIVLVGATATGLGDVYPTPLSAQRGFTPGVEISATVADNLLSGQTRQLLAPWVSAALTLLLAALVLPALWLLAPGWALGAALGGIALAVAASAALLLRAGLWFPPGAAMLAIAAFYLAWNWRRLEHAATYLVEELARLRRHDAGLPAGHASARAGDLIDRRIEDLAHATGRLREVQAFMSSVIESLPDAALAVGEDGRVLLANRAAARYFGDAAAERAEMPWLLAGLAQINGGALPWPPVVEPGRPVECRDHAGKSFLFDYAPCAGLGELATAWIVTLVDITPLREAERRRDQALRFLSHDIRSPQGAILALLDLHGSDPDELPKEELLRRIRRYVLRTQDLADSFVELARVATVAMKETELDGADLLLDAADECWSLAQAKGIRLDTEVPEEAAMLKGDHALLVRALVNLIGNAIKFSPADSVVACRLYRAGKLWCMAVKDQGRGIAPEAQARLFQEFSRIEAAEGEREEAGFGLGLAFVKAVAERHGGRVECSSAPGQGAEFRLLLP